MSLSAFDFSKKEKRTVILAVTIGNLLEWYEIYLYVYWAPILSKLFFDSKSDLANLTNTFLLFAVGFLARPIGGVFFGRLGDLIGRKKSLLLSMLLMTIPTFVTGFLPTYATLGLWAPVILGIMRVLQAFPAGGEIPGAFCYLYESSRFKNRRFLCSWGGVGFQVGILISTIECFILEKYLPHEDLITWGWRLSFIIGGLIGLLGLLLRSRLHETPLYKEMVTHETVVKEPLMQVINEHKNKIGRGILYCALNSSSFYLLTVNLPVYFGTELGFTYSNNLILTFILLIFVTVPLPFFGLLADKLNNNKKTLILTTLGIIAILYPLSLTINNVSILFTGILIVLFSLLFTWQSALIPYIMPDLFPIRVRFTCVGLSYNLVDALIGGFTPVIALYLLNLTGKEASFTWILLGGALLSLSGYLMMKEKHPPHPH